MDDKLKEIFQKKGWKYWDLREESDDLNPDQFDPRVGKLVRELQRRLSPPYGISAVEDYTRKPRDERTLANITIYETLEARAIDTATVSVQTGGHVAYNDLTDGKVLEKRLQGLQFG